MPSSQRSQQDAHGLVDELVRAVRTAVRAEVRAELGDLHKEGGCLREAMRSEVGAALSSWSGKPTMNVSRLSTAKSNDNDFEAVGSAAVVAPDEPKKPGLQTQRTVSMKAQSAAMDHLSSFFAEVMATHSMHEIDQGHAGWRRRFTSSEHAPGGYFIDEVERKWEWLMHLTEPPHSGPLATFVASSTFEAIVCTVISLNCAFMVFAADKEIQSPGSTVHAVLVGDWVFQIFYTVELLVKLVVHRQWFFWNDAWKRNIFDVVLVTTGFISLCFDGGVTGSFMRVFRLLKFGKAIRAIRLLSQMEQLRAFLVCLQGSFSSLFWSLVMLFTVYALVSLLLMQIVVTHLAETGESIDGSSFDELYGSVGRSVLTLYKASTGGDDWSVAYQVIERTGQLGAFFYLCFIAFVQFALINIITGIFVESAMSTLSPDFEARAREQDEKEKDNARKLKNLCIHVDADCSGKLTREQFEDGLRRNHIPLLLTLLGLSRHHVLEFFNCMAEVSDDGQVEIDSFVNGCMLLKGAATNFDLQKLHAEFKASQTRNNEFMAEILARVDQLPPT